VRRADERRAETRALLLDPGHVVSREELTAVEVEGALQGLGALGFAPTGGDVEEGAKLGAVGRHRLGVELDGAARREDDLTGRDPGRFELMPQRRERLAQIVARRRGAVVGPDELDQRLARMRPLEEVRQVSEDRGRLLRPEAGRAPGPASDPELAHELDPQARVHSHKLDECSILGDGIRGHRKRQAKDGLEQVTSRRASP
jgi:hypothetical protein